MSDEREKAIQEFIDITGHTRSIAEQYLNKNDFIVTMAVNDYYNNEHITPGTKADTTPKAVNNPNVKQRKSGGSTLKSFSDLKNDNGSDDDDGDINFFTGGEKSGLAVEDPNKKKNGRSLVDELLEKAQREAGEPDWRDNADSDEASSKKQKSFRGTGHSLGSVENAIESKTIEDPSNQAHGFKKPEKVTRTITFWKEGFSVDDGELYKYDDPKNQEYLQQLNTGRAPLSLLNVQMFQDVDVNVDKKLEDSYYSHQKSKPRVFGFQGTGKRLGSPVPGEPTTVEEALAREEAQQATLSQTNTEATAEKTAALGVAGSGDTTIQIRLGTGERLVQRFNSTDAVESIYTFVANHTNDSRAWGLVTSFPTQPLDDKKQQSIADSKLKNSVVIQKWK